MASFRRTPSPSPSPSPAYHPNGFNFNDPFTIQSPSHKLHNSPSSLRFLSWIFIHRHAKKGNQVWRFYFLRFLFCFVFGFLLGLIPFNHHVLVVVDDNNINVKPQDFDFEFKKPPPPHPVRENIVFDTVSLGAVEGKGDIDLGLVLPRKQLIVVTPTYNRALQAFFLHRLSQVLRLVQQPVLWIVVEMKGLSMETSEILRKSGVMYRHLVCNKNSTDVKDRGVHQRNTALEHIQQHKLDGIVYFADDDNIYSLQLFESLRGISRFGTWPVAMLAPSKNKAILEGPVCNGSQVIGWHTNEKSKRLRRFHVDMSGFAFNSTILWDPKRWHRPTSVPIRQQDTVKEGFQETTFIEQIVEDESQMEATPNGCFRILNWHLHLEARNFVYPRKWELLKNLNVVVSII